MGWCENHRVGYVFGFARNPLLRRKIVSPMRQAKQEHQRTGKAARVLTEFSSRTRKSWSCSRRVVAKAEYLEKGENLRFVVGKRLYRPCGPSVSDRGIAIASVGFLQLRQILFHIRHILRILRKL